MLESDNQMQGTCFFGDFFTLVDVRELERGWKLNIQCKGVYYKGVHGIRYTYCNLSEGKQY